MKRATLVRILVPTAFIVLTASAAPLGASGSSTGPTTVPTQGRAMASVGPRGKVFPASRNFRVVNKADAQSETTVAVDPTNPNHMLAASNDLSAPSGATTVIYESFDRGRTWENAGLGLPTSQFCYDPWLDFNAAGDAFFAYECFDQRVAYRRVGQVAWTKTVLGNAGGFPDRDMIVVDTGPGSPFQDSVYIGYDDANQGNAAYLIYSRDGFGSWVRTPQLNASGGTIGVNAAVGPGGEVYACWLDWVGRRLEVDRSFNGGATWGADVVAHNYRIATEQFFIFIPPQPQRGIVPMCFSDAAPAGGAFAGRLYVTYTDKDPVSADTNVYVVYSDDDGMTWSAESKVNDDAVNAYQFHPTISVAPNGTVAVNFYDTREDPVNDEKTHQYVAFSTNGGVTWSANLRVSTAQSDESGFGDPNDYGDYQGIDATSTNFWQLIWTDSRPGTNAEDMVTASARM
jgi:hypothetical protein